MTFTGENGKSSCDCAHVVRTLRRIRQVIAESIRLYESTDTLNPEPLLISKQNLIRISQNISSQTNNKLNEV